MKNFVISLPQAVHRREHIKRNFAKANVAFEFFDAVSHEQIDAHAQKFHLNTQGSVLTDSEVGCLLSHASIWRWMVEHECSYVAIFEDDVILGKEAEYFLSDHDWIPESCDVVKLEVFHPNRAMALKSHRLQHGRKLRRLLESHVGMAGYILSLPAAKWALTKLLQTHPLIPIDQLLFNAWLLDKEQNMYQMSPAICVQSDRVALIVGNGHDLHGVYHEQLPSQLEKKRAVRPKFDKPTKANTPKPTGLSAKLVRESLRPYRQLKRALIDTTSTIGFK